MTNQKYSLSLIENKEEELYGIGDNKYIIELLEDFLCCHDMYGKKEINIKIKKENNNNM